MPSPDHGDAMAALLQLPHMVQLVLGRLIAPAPLDAGAPGQAPDCAGWSPDSSCTRSLSRCNAPTAGTASGRNASSRSKLASQPCSSARWTWLAAPRCSGRQTAERRRTQFQLARLPPALRPTLRLTRHRPRSPRTPRRVPARGLGRGHDGPRSGMQRVPGQRGREPQCLGGIGSGPAMAVHDRDLRCASACRSCRTPRCRCRRTPPAPGGGAPARRAAPARRPQPAWRPAWPATRRRGR